ncbi:MAG TPA: SPOR domain-containing protein [Candidatus Marinimicrobia bacterium]|nr:SPOR domain-containing protein [Candidatus Neomarinimicrobiota bacterium]HRS51025.1 SPOR domain-containing protein [Candidatus Neomarinimicrobiota bacterium]HRU92532.1 SPOR domain-containing protein [Candidatus Neomarinimicrobiota bacterium]
MKKLSITLTILLILLGNCTKKPVVTGIVGNSVNLIPTIKNSEDTTACAFKWSFNAKPAESILDVLSFIPDSRSFSVSFIPDVPGEYELQFLSQDKDGKEKFKQIIKCSVSSDTTQSLKTGSVANQIPPRDLSAPPPKYVQPTPAGEYETTYSAGPKSKAVSAGKNIPKVRGKYTVQLGSYKNYNRAESKLRDFKAHNLDAYIQKAYFKETNETWYRIRTGTFDSYAEAKKVMKDLKARFPNEDLWIDFVREDQ